MMTSNTQNIPNKANHFFTRYPLILFYLLAILISWTFWFIEPEFRVFDALTAGLLIQIGTFGPVLAAMLISALVSRKKVSAPLRLRLIAGLLVLAITVYINLPSIKRLALGDQNILHWILLAVMILMPAWIFYHAHSAICGVQKLLVSLTHWKINPIWFLSALFLMLGLSLAGLPLTSLLKATPLTLLIHSALASDTLKHLGVTFLATAITGGPLGEEAGWRGFALPRLQKRFDPLLASVILGFLWGFWHLPLHLTGYYDAYFGNAINGLVMRLFSSIPLALIFTWLYNRSGGNLLAMVFLHTAVNVTSSIIPTDTGMFITLSLAVIAMIVFDRMYKKAPHITPQAVLEIE